MEKHDVSVTILRSMLLNFRRLQSIRILWAFSRRLDLDGQRDNELSRSSTFIFGRRFFADLVKAISVSDLNPQELELGHVHEDFGQSSLA